MTDEKRIIQDVEVLTGRRGPKDSRAVTLAELDKRLASVATTITEVRRTLTQQKVPQIREAINQINRDIYNAQTATSEFIEQYVIDSDAIQTQITTLSASIGANSTSIQEIYNYAVDENGAVAQSIDSLETNFAAANASITAQGQAIAILEGYAAATYTLRAKAGSAIAELELVAASDPINGDVSSFRISADQMLLEGSVYARMMFIDELLAIDSVEAGFSMGKSSAWDLLNDGIYMGRTELTAGGAGFGFLSGRVRPDGLQEYIQHTAETGLKIANANFLIEGGVGNVVLLTTDQDYFITPGTTYVVLQLFGGGGGGGGVNDEKAVAGQTGGLTTAEITNAADVPVGSWLASGGIGSASVNSTGESTSRGTGGLTDAIDHTNHLDGGHATGYGAGGGSGTGRWNLANGTPVVLTHRGGGAGETISTPTIDVTGITDPFVRVVIGAGGDGNGGHGASESMGGNGAPGLVVVMEFNDTLQQAGVVAQQPTATGSFSYTAGTTPFPDIAPGKGFWTTTGLDAESVSIVGGTVVLTGSNTHAFFSAETPQVVATGSGDVDFAFWAMA